MEQIATRMADDGDEIARAALRTEYDLIRAAGFLLRERSGGMAQPRYSVVADALYRGQNFVPATYLGRQIAKFAGSDPKMVAIATTNFDDVLEQALLAEQFEVIPCSLDEGLDSWWSGFDDPIEDRFHVLHLHGHYGRAASRPIGPVLLTEDEFRANGARVQEEVAKILDRSEVVLCIGMSLTDPNLLGPLSERRDSSHVYATMVASKQDGVETAEDAEELADVRVSYMEDMFKIHVLPLNAYAQLGQVMIELELARSQPRQYMVENQGGRKPIRYGFRLSRSLSRAYRTCHWPPTSEPSGTQLRQGSDVLNSLLERSRPSLVKLVENHKSKDLRQLAKDLDKNDSQLRSHLEREGLAIFLWLQRRFDPASTTPPRAYQLQLIGSSAYSHRSYWSFQRAPVEVSAYADTSHGKAAFSGRPVIEPTTLNHEPRLWRTNISVPVVDRGNSTAPVNIGVLTLASNRSLKHDELTSRAAIAFLDAPGRAAYCEILAEAAAELFSA